MVVKAILSESTDIWIPRFPRISNPTRVEGLIKFFELLPGLDEITRWLRFAFECLRAMSLHSPLPPDCLPMAPAVLRGNWEGHVSSRL